MYMRWLLIIALIIFTLAVSAYKPVETMENQTQETCPSVLVKKGNELVLYNESKQELTRFSNLDEYIEFTKNQRARGVECPVLFLQQENNTQGNDVYRVRTSPFELNGGSQPVDIIDASRSSSKYNVNNYPGFDPMGLQVGVFNKLDQVHASTGVSKVSDNPMDLNWGGVDHTQQAVDSGKYEENQVSRPSYFNPKAQFTPGMYADKQNPPSYVNSDLTPKW
jgi:hypothetical protein